MDKLTVDAIRSGYTFLDIGKLFQAAIEIQLEACRRFGVEKADGIISIALYDADKSPEYLVKEIKDETGILVSHDDLEFLGKIAAAQMLINSALNELLGA